MSQRSDGRLELILLGGFLGAGKTNFLRHQLFLGNYARHHVLINEAAHVAVDDLLLQTAYASEVIAGGCACCEGLPNLLHSLRAICAQKDTGVFPDLEGLILETSGMASLTRIARAIAADPVLSQRIALGHNIVIVDGLHGAAQLSQEPLWHDQIEAATQLIITKAATAPDLARLWPTLRTINPDAQILACDFGVEVELPAGQPPFALAQLGTNQPLTAQTLDLGTSPDWAVLSVWLSAVIAHHGDQLLRVKGCIATQAGALLFQSVRKTVQAPEIMPSLPPTANQLVFIGRGFGHDLFQTAWDGFSSG